MPVVVTGASGLVGRRAVAAFLRTSPEVRAYVRRRDAAELLRGLGAKVAVGEIDDVDRLNTVMADAHTACHLVGGFDLPNDDAYLRVNLGSVEAVIQAARRAGVGRILFLSYPAASPGSPNPFLRAKGLAEEAIRDSGLDHVIVRTTRIYGPGQDWLRFAAWARASKRPVAYVVGTGLQTVAPTYVEDAARLLAAADDRDRLVSGTWGLEGPDRLTLDDLVDLLAGRSVPKVHLRGRWRIALHQRRRRRRPSPVADQLWAADSLAEGPDAAMEFGVSLTPLAVGLERSLAAEPSEPHPGAE